MNVSYLVVFICHMLFSVYDTLYCSELYIMNHIPPIMNNDWVEIICHTLFVMYDM